MMTKVLLGAAFALAVLVFPVAQAEAQSAGFSGGRGGGPGGASAVSGRGGATAYGVSGGGGGSTARFIPQRRGSGDGARWHGGGRHDGSRHDGSWHDGRWDRDDHDGWADRDGRWRDRDGRRHRRGDRHRDRDDDWREFGFAIPYGPEPPYERREAARPPGYREGWRNPCRNFWWDGWSWRC
jgi:hypothetical protein